MASFVISSVTDSPASLLPFLKKKIFSLFLDSVLNLTTHPVFLPRLGSLVTPRRDGSGTFYTLLFSGDTLAKAAFI